MDIKSIVNDILGEIITRVENAINIDNMQLDLFNMLSEFIKDRLIPIIKESNEEISALTSCNNSKCINRNIEHAVQQQLAIYVKEKYGYCISPFLNNLCDTGFDLKDNYLQVDCKGISVGYEKKKLNNENLIGIIKQFEPDYIKAPTHLQQAKKYAKDNGIDLTGTKKLKDVETKMPNFIKLTPTEYNTKYLKDNYGEELSDNYELINGFYWIKDNKLIEINPMGTKFQDHAPGDFHMKTSQSCLTNGGEGYKSTIDGKEVIYKGLLPKNTDKPQNTFIIKHVYTENDNKNPEILRIELYSIPHNVTERFYKLQKKNNVNRPAKAKEEFRFNMNDENGEPYKFINSDEPRYKVFNLTD